MASLEYELNGRSCRLELKTDAECCIGRDPDCPVCLADVPKISRRHCVIYFNTTINSFALADLYSTDGTWLNGRKIGRMDVPLHDGDTVTAGPVVFRFKEENRNAGEQTGTGTARLSQIARPKSFLQETKGAGTEKYRYKINDHFLNGDRILEGLQCDDVSEIYLTISEKDELRRLKILKELPMDPAAGTELKKAAEKIPELTGILRPVDAGALENGACWRLDPYLELTSYDRMISLLAPVPQIQAIALIYSAAMTLDLGFRHGIFHGNLTPSKILYDPHTGITIAGMGFSLWREHFFPKLDHRPGQWYAAPETAAGSSVWQSDQYALGIMLFQLLTGILPFRADDPDELAAMHREKTMPLPSERNGQVRTIPAVDAAIVRLTMKDPAERYESWKELLSDLERANSILKKKQSNQSE